ncbi:tRNA pseudouridine(55) synthase TruB [Candidatus Saccharibacteria bacterium]|nr:MAG: tRNA pseudouridine(55) synthase TruB [Candidatus Saccharibacteria bacterium]
MQGVLLIDKPKGWTSFDVVNYVRKQVAALEGKKPKNCKVGHAGTLDPLATGLLVLMIGKEYTRRSAELSKHDKTYVVTMKLGETSTTGDDEGEKNPVSTRIPSKSEVEKALQSFEGESMQIPPAYSAIKIHGQRAYKLARTGKPVELEPRRVTIYKTQLTEYSYPFVHFMCDVSSGTYVRSLVEDIGAQLGTGAYMSDLQRTRVGEYKLDMATGVDDDNFVSHVFEIVT